MFCERSYIMDLDFTVYKKQENILIIKVYYFQVKARRTKDGWRMRFTRTVPLIQLISFFLR
jgi:hypothetical protein